MSRAFLDVWEGWHRDLCVLELAHRKAAARSQSRHKMIGIPVILLSVIVGSGVFATLQQDTEIAVWLKAAVVAISFLAAALSSIQTFLKYGEKATRHKSAAVGFGELKKDLERVGMVGGHPDLDGFLEGVKTRWSEIADEAPDLPDPLRARARREVEQEIDRDERWAGIRCTGRVEDLYVHAGGGEARPIGDHRRWSYVLGPVRLDRSQHRIRLNAPVEAVLPDGKRRQYRMVGEGSIRMKSAHLVYSFLKPSGEVAWHGVMALRMPAEGDIHGYWLTTDVTDIDTSFIMGRITLSADQAAAAAAEPSEGVAAG